MKILIIDNGTKHLAKLKKLLVDLPFKVVNYSEIDVAHAKNFDVIILSGGHNFPVCGNEGLLKKEINLIKTSKAKIFGICFGFELIAYAFGAKLKPLKNKEHGIIDIKIVKPDEIFSEIDNFQVYEGHRWVIKKADGDLTALAKSKDGIEAIKHKKRPIYAVQFHPEMFVNKTCGDEIFHNFLKLMKN
ncbi:MAG: gamma-glutamyl-gamma-aminobutyrate hydrolase family protein [Candidatus Buchananbacteria bacterium]